MTQLNSPIEILKLFDKSNCRECGYATCLAFASAVFKGQKPLAECPHLKKDVIDEFGGEARKINTVESNPDEPSKDLKKRLRTIDLASAARRVGAEFSNGKLTLKVCGKDLT